MDPKQLSHVATYEHPGTLYALGYDADAERLFAGGSDGAIWTVQPREEEKPRLRTEEAGARHENYISCLAVSAGSVISGSYDRTLMWTDAASGQRIRSVEAHDGWVRDLALFPDGRRLVSVGDDMRVKIWDAEGPLIHSLDGHARRTEQGYTTALYAVAVSPDGKVVASGDRTGEVRLWNADDGTLLRTLRAPSFYTYDAVKRVRSIGGIRCLRFSAAGDRLAIGGIGQVTNVDGFVGPIRLELWDWREPKRLLAGEGKHKAVLNDVLFGPDDEWLLAGGGGDSGGILAAWQPGRPEPLHTAKPKGHLHRLVLNPRHEQLYCAGFGGIQVWSCAS